MTDLLLTLGLLLQSDEERLPRIVFTQSSHVFVMDADGSNVRQLTNAGHDSTPASSPNGKCIAFARDGKGIFLMDADGGNVVQITQGNDCQPAWRPGGTRLAFTRDNREIWLVNADGSDLRKVNTPKGRAGSPAWSPDGKSLAYELEEEGAEDSSIWIATESEARKLSATDEPESRPEWASVGGWIAFVRGETRASIVVAKPDGSKEMTVPGTAGAMNVRWSFQCAVLLFTTFDPPTNKTEIVLINLDGTNRRVIRRSDDAKATLWDVCWGARPPTRLEEHLRIGNEKYQKGDFEGAAREFEKAVALDPENSLALCWRGYAYADAGKLQAGLADGERLIQLFPKWPGGYHLRGYCRLWLDDPEGGLVDATKALELDPKNSSAFYIRGRARLAMKHYQSAVDDLREAVSLSPEFVSARLFLAQAWSATWRHEAAHHEYTEAIRRKPDCWPFAATRRPHFATSMSTSMRIQERRIDTGCARSVFGFWGTPKGCGETATARSSSTPPTAEAGGDCT